MGGVSLFYCERDIMARPYNAPAAHGSRDYPGEAAAKRGITEAVWTALLSVWSNAPSAETVLTAFDTCTARGYDPLKGHAALVKGRTRNGNQWVDTYNVWPTLKSLVYTAHKTGSFAGMDPVQYGPTITRTFKGADDDNGRNRPLEVDLTFPEWVSCTVYRIVAGQRFPFTEIVYFEEMVALTSGLPTSLWRTKPRLMLTKCAKSAALRIAFAECDFSADEMDGQSVELAEVVSFDRTAPAHDTTPSPTGGGVPVHSDPVNPVPSDPEASQDDGWGDGGFDRADGEPFSQFSQVGGSGLYWLSNALKTAISTKAFGPAIKNAQASLPVEAHPLAEALFEAAKLISQHKSSASIFGYVEKAGASNNYAGARAGMDDKEKKGMVDAPTKAAVLVLLDFNEAVDADAALGNAA